MRFNIDTFFNKSDAIADTMRLYRSLSKNRYGPLGCRVLQNFSKYHFGSENVEFFQNFQIFDQFFLKFSVFSKSFLKNFGKF